MLKTQAKELYSVTVGYVGLEYPVN